LIKRHSSPQKGLTQAKEQVVISNKMLQHVSSTLVDEVNLLVKVREKYQECGSANPTQMADQDQESQKREKYHSAKSILQGLVS